MKYLPLTAMLGVMVCSHVHAEDVSDVGCPGGGASSLADCLNTALQANDKRLNAVYSLIMRMFDAGAVDPMTAFFYDKKKDLVAAERAWVKFRDAQCGAEATMLGSASASGTVQVTFDCLSKMTEERIAYLEHVASSLKLD